MNNYQNNSLFETVQFCIMIKLNSHDFMILFYMFYFGHRE